MLSKITHICTIWWILHKEAIYFHWWEIRIILILKKLFFINKKANKLFHSFWLELSSDSSIFTIRISSIGTSNQKTSFYLLMAIPNSLISALLRNLKTTNFAMISREPSSISPLKWSPRKDTIAVLICGLWVFLPTNCSSMSLPLHLHKSTQKISYQNAKNGKRNQFSQDKWTK